MASLIGAHDILASCTSPSGKIYKDAITRILHLDLVTSTPLEELKKFYTSVLGLTLVSAQSGRFTVQAGETSISFSKTNADSTAPFYHFAFNIPENKILKAREWQLKRTTLSATPSQLVDESYPKDIRHFRHWNAHSVFFWDPAGNLVEYIARHDLKNSVEGDFTSKDILCASEIAFIVDDADSIASEIKSSLNLPQYRSGDANFRAIGDENGLLLVIKRGRIWESHSTISKTPETIKTAVTIHADKNAKWIPKGYPFGINGTTKR
jgi:catechol 2,3-dioxygenase-like lactoylglutathione lyase family enzyme